MAEKSAVDVNRCITIRYRRAIIGHLVRQSGGPTPDPRDALRLASRHYGLVPRQASVGRFTARIARTDDGQWALDFNSSAPKYELVAAIWHELSELLCLSDDLVEFDHIDAERYQESAVSAYDRRHLCAVGVERYVRAKLRQFPEVREYLLSTKVRHILLARSSTAPGEPLLPSIVREPWFDDECVPDDLTFVV
jgi:hypothetical protein